MRIEGEIAVGEASRFAAKATSRLNGHPMPMIVSNVISGVVGAGVIFAFGIVQQWFDLPGWLWLPALIAAIWVGIFAGLRACRVWALGFARKAFAQRGLVNPVPSRFVVTDDGFAAGTGRATLQAPWEAVSDLFPVGPYWVLLVEGHPQFLPKRFFDTPGEERAFIGAIFGRMSLEAQARSPDAATLAALPPRAG
jgi:hypothetical protein